LTTTGNNPGTSSFRRRSDQLEAIWRPEIARLSIPSIARPEAELLASLAAATGSRRTFELGTAIGYSSAYLATGMGAAGHVDAVDLNPERAAVARRLWASAGLSEQISLHEGDALEVAQMLGSGFDLGFVDLLWEVHENDLGRELARLATIALRPGGILIADNCGQAIPAGVGFMAEVASGPFRTTTLLPLGDGVLLAVKE
jgi:predicted O-methyltransferase YrrM